MKAGREGWSLAGSIAAATAASACCIGPVLLALMGLGGAAFAMRLAPSRPYLLGMTVLLLGTAFFFVYRRPACDGSSRRGLKIVLWLATALVAALLAFPWYVNYLV